MSEQSSKQRPFLKWAGNKYRILERILPMLPVGKRLIEPFAGSGAVFLNSRYPRYVLNDANRDLIDLYNIIKTEGEAFIHYARQYFVARNNQPERYYALRDQFNCTRSLHKKAALFIYLNRHGYNGLCRYNASGKFNVPFGRYRSPAFPEDALRAFHRRSRLASFRSEHFSHVMRKARPGDVVYCDPPYVPLTATANFTGYHSSPFGEAEQRELALCAEQLAGRGITVLISNHNTGFIQEVYRSADVVTFNVRRTISCNGARRGHASEVLALFS